MGFINIMKLQENPDGIEGHVERDVFQEISKCAPAKQRFAEGRDFHTYTVPIVTCDIPKTTKAQRRLLDLEVMKSKCNYVLQSCSLKNCPTCGRPKRIQRTKERTGYRHELISLRLRDPETDKTTYWEIDIAFSCPLTNKKHAIKDCFRWCKHWGATVDFESNPRGITLYCNKNPEERRELHSGEIIEV